MIVHLSAILNGSQRIAAIERSVPAAIARPHMKTLSRSAPAHQRERQNSANALVRRCLAHYVAPPSCRVIPRIGDALSELSSEAYPG